MTTIADQLTELVNQKNALAANLNTKGVTASTSETLNTLVPKVLEISSGGGGGGGSGDSGGQYLVQVIDYDGTVVKSDHLDTGATFTLPDAPTKHSKLVFQEWSSPVDIVDNTITVGNSDITIGATYKTASGLTEIDITLTKVTGLSVTCNMVGNKNWGDGTTNSETTHTYTNYGKYTITCDGTSIPDGSNSSSGMFSSSSSSINYYCTEIRIGELVTNIGSYAFQFCYSLTSITIPSSVTLIRTYMFYNCLSLTSITIPSSVIFIGNYAFSSCYSSTSIAIPSSVTNIIGNYAFQYCYSLTSITIPSSVTNIGTSAFQYCYSLTSITIPSSVTNIGTSAFANCRSIIKYDFTSSTSVPSLLGTSVFNYNNKICKIYVPDALYDDWIVATNWATYADYIYKASEMED